MKTIQMVLTMSTERADLRADVVGWGSEDPRLFKPGEHIGHTPGTYKSPDCPPHYKTVLEALADGWKLLGPPQEESWTREEDGARFEQWGWWLVKDVDANADMAPYANNSPWRTML